MNRRLITVVFCTSDCKSYLVLIIYPIQSSDKKLCCSLLLLENCEILEKISTNISENVRKEDVTVGQREETLWNWVTNSKTVRVEMPAIMKSVLFTQGKKVLLIVQLDVNSYLESSAESSALSMPIQLDFYKIIIYFVFSLCRITGYFVIILCSHYHIAFLKIFKPGAVESRYSGRPS